MGWTDEQQRVIDTKDASILVSAAAGSGKTAVLVERITQKILDENNPCDIDEFLVVTFTHAAADNMKDKISSGIEKALAKNPDNEHLVRQFQLVNRADITTIDSFCLKIVKENIALLGLDSSFGIGDPGMMELVKSDVLEQLFDGKYELEDNSESKMNFLNLLDIFETSVEDGGLKNVILSIYNTASSFPNVDTWLDNAKKSVDITKETEPEEMVWFGPLVSDIKSKIKDCLWKANYALMLAEMDGGPDKNIPKVQEDICILERIMNAKSYEELRLSTQVSWPRLASCKGDAYDTDILEQFKELRNEYKDIVKSISIFNLTKEELLDEMQQLKSYIIPLIDLTKEFIELYDAKKNSMKLLTFSDIEHYAYKLLCAGYDDNGKAIPTELAKIISKQYKEIYIDEYQDGNYLQEDILYAVSGYHRDNPNMFMVGDVKQSIYRFRMARPDIFMGKYNSFKDAGNEVKIELNNNFRSRDKVLNPTNFIFYQLMGEDLGGITYDDKNALKPTKDFPEPEEALKDRISNSAEVYFIDSSNDDDGALDKTEELSEDELNLENVKLEAVCIANRIKELVNADNGMMVYDEETERYRRARYSDIVILGRSIKGFGESVAGILTDRNIPVYLEEQKGYFNAVEIQVIMSLLTVVDNSRQDIPLAALLLSPMANLDENELATITAYAQKNLSGKDLIDHCTGYCLDNEDEISTKLEKILTIIEKLKNDRYSLSISELIYEALELTGYYEYASAMPMGKRRRANIDMLIEKARCYEDGFYKGLFNFLRYIDKLKTNDMDFGEASVVSADENVVRIMSMHKSKGLEYPIVFVSGLGRQFNNMDTKENLIIHSDYYLAGYVMNKKHRFKKKSMARQAIKLLMKKESLGEELRILYVALTRAKEKLIITGCGKKFEGYYDKAQGISSYEDILLPYSFRSSAQSFAQLIINSLERYDRYKDKMKTGEIKIHKLDRADVLSIDVADAAEQKMTVANIHRMLDNLEDDSLLAAYRESFDYEYAYKVYTEITGKLSVSDIKKMKAYNGTEYDVNTETEAVEHYDEIVEKTDFVADEDRLSGAQRGTLIHKFMELINFNECVNSESPIKYIKAFLDKLLCDNIFDEREKKAINCHKIRSMVLSELGLRMAKADAMGMLKREQQFSIGIPVEKIYELDNIKTTEDVIIVQGIIDAFFYEGDDIVLMDYKTDRATKEELIGRYKAQIDYYAETLERLTGKKVKERYLYSFYLEEQISI